jgi:sensor histidine kinase YesM
MQKIILYKQIQFLIHFCFWVFFIHILFDIGGLYESFIRELDPKTVHHDDAFIIIPFTILLFYLNYSYLTRVFFNTKNRTKYFVLLILVYIGFIILVSLFFLFLDNQGIQFQVPVDEIYEGIPFIGLFVIAISSSVRISEKGLVNERIKLEAEEKQREAEVNFLTAQINPHFLFNSLNSIYSIAEQENSPRSVESVLKLSEIMRYPMNEGTFKNVPITSEIDFLKNYIDFQKIRLGDDYPIEFIINGDFDNREIAPLLFIPMVENAIKYGVSPLHKSPISFNLSLKDEKLNFKVENQIVNNKKVQSHKLGLDNLKSRLELIYSNNHSLIIKQNEKTYIIELIISLKK